MGHRKGFLDDAIKKTAEALFGKESEDFEIRSMKARPGRQERSGSEPELNLLEQILADREEVDLPRNDPDKSFDLVCRALERALVRNKGNL